MEKLAIDPRDEERFKLSPRLSILSGLQHHISINTALDPNLIASALAILLLLRPLEKTRLIQFIPSWRTPEINGKRSCNRALKGKGYTFCLPPVPGEWLRGYIYVLIVKLDVEKSLSD